MSNKYAPIIEKLQGHHPNSSLSQVPLDEMQLNKIELQLGHPLPTDYREFIRDYAGATINHALFPFTKSRVLKEGSVSGFYGPTHSQPKHSVADIYASFLRNYDPLEDMYEWYPGLNLIREPLASKTESGWPEELLPIGYDLQANHICLALFGLRPGSIFFWINTPYEGAQNVYLVADTFDEFLHLLQRYE